MIVLDREVAALAARLRARAGSVLLNGMPDTQADMRLAGRILERVLQDGLVFSHIRLDPDEPTP
jgi:hypothetical protein